MNDADDQAASSPMLTKRAGQEDVPSPSGLLAFPPLAYLLNALLSGFNIIRECPLTRVREDVLKKLAIVLEESCKFLADISDDVRSRGAKYLSGTSTGTGTANVGATSSATAAGSRDAGNKEKEKGKGKTIIGAGDEHKLDVLYANVLIAEFIPHVLGTGEVEYLSID